MTLQIYDHRMRPKICRAARIAVTDKSDAVNCCLFPQHKQLRVCLFIKLRVQLVVPTSTEVAGGTTMSATSPVPLCPPRPHIPFASWENCTVFPPPSDSPDAYVVMNCSLECAFPFQHSSGPEWVACSATTDSDDTATHAVATWDLPPHFPGIKCQLQSLWLLACVGAVVGVLVLATLFVCVQEGCAGTDARRKRRRHWAHDAYGWTQVSVCMVHGLRSRVRVFSVPCQAHSNVCAYLQPKKEPKRCKCLFRLWKAWQFFFNLGLTVLSFSSARVKEAQLSNVLPAFRKGTIGTTVARFAEYPVLVSLAFALCLAFMNLAIPTILRFTYDLYGDAKHAHEPNPVNGMFRGGLSTPPFTSVAVAREGSDGSINCDGQQAQRRPPRRHTKNFVARAISAAIHFFVSKAVPLLVARFSVTMLLSCFAPLIVFDFRSLQIYQVRRASVLANALARPLA